MCELLALCGERLTPAMQLHVRTNLSLYLLVTLGDEDAELAAAIAPLVPHDHPLRSRINEPSR